MNNRILLLFVLMLIAATSISGCGNDNSTPTQELIDGRKPLDLAIGETWRYEFFIDDENYGFNEYEVIAATDNNGEKSFTIKSVLELQESDACKPTTASGTMQVTHVSVPISYQMDISVGSG